MLFLPPSRRQHFLILTFVIATLVILAGIQNTLAKDESLSVDKDSGILSASANSDEKVAGQISSPKIVTEKSISLDKNKLEAKGIEKGTVYIEFITAIILFLSAVLGLRWFRFRRKKIIREESPLFDLLGRFANSLNIPLRRFKQAQDSFFEEIFQGISAEYLKYLFSVFTAKRSKDISSACDKLYHFLKNNPAAKIPDSLVEKGIRIIAAKCNHPKEQVSDAAFTCYSSFFQFTKSPDTFLDCFGNLLKEDNPQHVKYRAIIELCSFIEHPVQLSWNAKLQYLAFMKKTFQDLELLDCGLWSNKDTGIAEKCISSLSAFRDTPDIINELLPPATNVVEKHIKELVNVYSDTILKLGDSSRFKLPMTALICRQIERWLKKDNIDKRIKEAILPGLINYFNSNRKIRSTFPRIDFPRKVSFTLLNDTQSVFNGFAKNISDTGISFKLQGSLLDAPYQERTAGAEGVRFQEDNKTLKLSNVTVRIYEANEKDVCIEAKAEILRAWIEPAFSANLMTGFGAKFIDYDKAKINSYLASFA